MNTESSSIEISCFILPKVILGYHKSDTDDVKNEVNNLRYEFFYAGSANLQANRNYLRSIGSPLYEPTPFMMPSAKFGNSYWLASQHGSSTIPPTYLIKGATCISGFANYQSGVIDFAEVDMEISISSTTFNELITIENFKSPSYIRFKDCTFSGGFSISRIQCNELSFDNCTFLGSGLSINHVHINALSIIKCKINDLQIFTLDDLSNFIKYSNDILHEIKLSSLENSIIDKLSIRRKGVENLSLENNKSGEWIIDMDSDSLKINNVSDNEAKFNEIRLKFLEESDQLLLIKNITIDKLRLTGYIKKSTVVLSNISCRILTLDSITNEGQFRVSNLSVTDNGRIGFWDAQLGKADFNTVNFSKANAFTIRASNISEIITHDVRFPNNITTGDANDTEGIRAIYRQLKNAASKQGDKVNELKHERLELQYLTTLLKERKSADRWVLYLNNFTSDHGQNWVRAVFLLGGLAVLFFVLITWVLGYKIADWQLLPGNIASLIEFINPIHKYEAVFETSPSSLRQGLARLTDGIFRLIDSYLLFQFVRASRKYFRS